MIDKIKNRLASEQGFTLIELLVVMVILGILVAIAVPAYLSFTGKAKVAAGEANVRSAIPAAESWYQDDTNNGTGSYAGISLAKLNIEAPGIASTVKAGAFNGTDTAGSMPNSAYCVEDTELGGSPFHYVGGNPGTTAVVGAVGKILPGDCATAVTGITMA